MDTIQVCVVDNSKVFHEGIAQIISQINKVELVERYDSGQSFLNSLKRYYMGNKLPDIVLMEAWMPMLNGFETAKRAIYEFQNLKIIALTIDCEKIFLKDFFEAGFRGCIAKNALDTELEMALNTVYNGKMYVNNAKIFIKNH